MKGVQKITDTGLAYVLDTRSILEFYFGASESQWVKNALKDRTIQFYTHSQSIFEVMYVISKAKSIELANREHKMLLATFKVINDPEIERYASNIRVGLGLSTTDCLTLALAKFIDCPAVFKKTNEIEGALKSGLAGALKVKVLFLNHFSKKGDYTQKDEHKITERPQEIPAAQAVEDDREELKEMADDLKDLIIMKKPIEQALKDESEPIVQDEFTDIQTKHATSRKALGFNIDNLKTYTDSRFNLRSFPLSMFLWSKPPEEPPALKANRLYYQVYLSEQQFIVDFSFPSNRLDFIKRELELISNEIKAKLDVFQHPTIATVRMTVNKDYYEATQRKLCWFIVGEYVDEMITKSRSLDPSWETPNTGSIILAAYNSAAEIPSISLPSSVKQKVNVEELYISYLDRNETSFVRAIDNMISNILTIMYRGEGIALFVPKAAPEISEIALFLMKFSDLTGVAFSKY